MNTWLLLPLTVLLLVAACTTNADRPQPARGTISTTTPVRDATPGTEVPEEPTQQATEPTATSTATEAATRPIPDTPTPVPPDDTPTAALDTPTPSAAPDPPTAIPTAVDVRADLQPVGADPDDGPSWSDAVRTPDGAAVGVVTSIELNIRDAPSVDGKIVGSTYQGHTLTIYERVVHPEDGGQWYRVGPERYVSVWYVKPFVAPPPRETYRGHWVDVNLTSFYAIAYIDETPVYAAIIAAGRDGRTPLGEYHVFYRVRNETMDSATVGIPKGHPEYYYLEDVEYTQYFKEGGYAIHGNYWTPPSEFGGFTSNGCVGMLEADAAWFWEHLAEGSTINIHM